MNKVYDYRDIFDDCYPAYKDYEASVCLEYDRLKQCWKNDDVCFYYDADLGWQCRTASGAWNYGYDSLREAVVKYSLCLTDQQNDGRTYCAHKLENVDYQQRVGSPCLLCKVTWRYFEPQCDEKLFSKKCEELTQTLNMDMGGIAF